MDFIKKFEKLKKSFEKAVTTGINETFAIQVNMTDDDCGGAFYISYIDGILSVEPYDYRDHTAMITAKAADFEKLIGRKIDLEKAVIEGKIAIEGNGEHIKLMTELFPEPAKKTAVKKAPAKKASATKKPSKKETANKTPAKKEADKSASKAAGKAEDKSASSKANEKK